MSEKINVAVVPDGRDVKVTAGIWDKNVLRLDGCTITIDGETTTHRDISDIQSLVRWLARDYQVLIKPNRMMQLTIEEKHMVEWFAKKEYKMFHPPAYVDKMASLDLRLEIRYRVRKWRSNMRRLPFWRRKLCLARDEYQIWGRPKECSAYLGEPRLGNITTDILIERMGLALEELYFRPPEKGGLEYERVMLWNAEEYGMARPRRNSA